MLRSFAVPNRPNYDVSSPIVKRQRCRVDDIDIVGESSSPSCDDGPPTILAKAWTPMSPMATL
jgi:hypothetical protein